MPFSTILLIAIGLYFALMFFIGVRETKRASTDFDSYAVASKSMPGFMIAITFIAAALGAGDMIANADSGYFHGISWLFWVLGEQTGKVIFGLVFAGFIAKFAFRTIADFVDALVLNDKLTKIIIGFITVLPGIAWCAAQAMALGGVFRVFTGVDPLPLIVGSTAIFVIYTALGGIRAVIKTDMIQGVLIIVFGIVYYVAIMNQFHFDFGYLRDAAVAVDPKLWSLDHLNWISILTTFLSSFLALSVLHFYWQRLYARNRQDLWMGVSGGLLVGC